MCVLLIPCKMLIKGPMDTALFIHFHTHRDYIELIHKVKHALSVPVYNSSKGKTISLTNVTSLIIQEIINIKIMLTP